MRRFSHLRLWVVSTSAAVSLLVGIVLRFAPADAQTITGSSPRFDGGTVSQAVTAPSYTSSAGGSSAAFKQSSDAWHCLNVACTAYLWYASSNSYAYLQNGASSFVVGSGTGFFFGSTLYLNATGMIALGSGTATTVGLSAYMKAVGCDSSAAPGNATCAINANGGIASIAAGASSATITFTSGGITSGLISAAVATFGVNDATCKSLIASVSSTSVTFTANAACTANARFYYFLLG